MNQRYCILFAGAIGSGKSPIANYLSYKLNLPVFNNDIIRTEVKEDLLRMDEEEYERRRSQRAKEILEKGDSFIYDASIDRKWEKYKQALLDSGFNPIIVSLDFTKEKLIEIWKAKGYTEFNALDRTIEDHKLFLENHRIEVSVHLTDEVFLSRLESALTGVKETLNIRE